MLRRTGSRRRRSFIESMLLCSCLLLYILLERMNIFVSNIRVNDLVGKESCRSITRVETLKYKLDLELSTNCTFTIDKLAISNTFQTRYDSENWHWSFILQGWIMRYRKNRTKRQDEYKQITNKNKNTIIIHSPQISGSSPNGSHTSPSFSTGFVAPSSPAPSSDSSS